ncbi:hypothetical protein V500_08304 [Pseudogymnoascus sp. VKM F-4518 (FW-2643)]|nr:hypothetical protein V500_08304 [Pseudogymnoascus sp. VKM F-4518 (FW-2643)]
MGVVLDYVGVTLTVFKQTPLTQPETMFATGAVWMSLKANLQRQSQNNALPMVFVRFGAQHDTLDALGHVNEQKHHQAIHAGAWVHSDPEARTQTCHSRIQMKGWVDTRGYNRQSAHFFASRAFTTFPLARFDSGSDFTTTVAIMSLVSAEKSNFQFILRLLNTNVEGKQKVMYALTKIKGVGRRYSNLVCKKADVDLNKRAGELTSEELERIVTIIQNPTQYKIPAWFLNRQRDIVDGKDYQVLANNVDSKLRDDLERLKKIRAHRGLRHYWGLRVRGQHSKTTGRRGRTVGVSKKKGG